MATTEQQAQPELERVLGRDRSCSGRRPRTPTSLPVVGALTCTYRATPWAERPVVQHRIAGVLRAIGVVLWAVTVVVDRRTGTTVRMDPEALSGDGPVDRGASCR